MSSSSSSKNGSLNRFPLRRTVQILQTPCQTSTIIEENDEEKTICDVDAKPISDEINMNCHNNNNNSKKENDDKKKVEVDDDDCDFTRAEDFFDFGDLKDRFLEVLQQQNVGEDKAASSTDDAFFELDDDDECSLPSSPTSPSSATMLPPSIAVPLPPKSAPPYATLPATTQITATAATTTTTGDIVNGVATSLSGTATPTILHSHTSLLHANHISPTHSTHNGIAEARLQQSLSTPCNGSEDDVVQRKDSEYRRFKSEGSTAGANLVTMASEVATTHLDELSPIDQRLNGTRFALMQQDSVVNPAITTKQSHTEQVAMMHTLKTKVSKYQAFIDRACECIGQTSDEKVLEGCAIIIKLMKKAWLTPKVCYDLGNALCDYMRDREYLNVLIKMFLNQTTTCEQVRLCCGKVLEEVMSSGNRDYIVNKNYLKKMMTIAMKLNKNPDQQRLSLSLMENMFKHSTVTSLCLIENGVLDHILLTCKRATECPDTLRHAAMGLANLALYSCSEGKKKILQKKVPDWLFLLASQPDDITRYYSCLAICMLTSTKELEAAVTKSGTLPLVEPFLLSHQDSSFIEEHSQYTQGKTRDWLMRLLPLLKSPRRESRSTVAFHFCLEAAIKKDQNKLDLFQEIGAIQALKEVASSPDEVAAKFASDALTIIGEEVPYKLAQQVPSWTADDVQYWVKKIGFEEYVGQFARHMVDGDILLHVTENDLTHDIGMRSGLQRKRFMRELESLKIAADYSSVDESNLDQFLMNLSPELSVYTYQMLSTGINRSLLSSLNDDLMQNACGIHNPIHRLKLTQAFENAKHPDDVEVAMLSKQIDVFISYRRSTGNQLASLIKVLLQLRGYKVFIDVDKLYAGKFDSSLLKNIQAAKHFILVLTPNSLDRLLNDDNCEDWVHKELKCAFDYQKNIIPIFDQSFEFPLKEDQIPQDIRNITKYNGVKWVHDYQDACMAKVVRFITGELKNTPTSKDHFQMPAVRSSKSSVRSWNAQSYALRSAAGSGMASNRSINRQIEPPTPTFTPTSSQERASIRRKIQSSVSTVSDRVS